MTKDTREAIARILQDSIPSYTEMLTCKDIADEILDHLTALEPAQAGGDVRELVAFAEMVRDLPIKNKNMPHAVWLGREKHTGPLADWFAGEFLPKLKDAAAKALTATPAQPTPSGET